MFVSRPEQVALPSFFVMGLAAIRLIKLFKKTKVQHKSQVTGVKVKDELQDFYGFVKFRMMT